LRTQKIKKKKKPWLRQAQRTRPKGGRPQERQMRTTTATAITAHNVNSSSSESESEVLFTRRLQLTAQKTGGQNGVGYRGWKTKQHLKVKANGKVC